VFPDIRKLELLMFGEALSIGVILTKAVVARLVLLSPASGVGAVGLPVNTGEVSGAVPAVFACTAPCRTRPAPFTVDDVVVA
jgi:hypothetical protein